VTFVLILAAVGPVDSLYTRNFQRAGSTSNGKTEKSPMGSLHEIVGPDGVLVIHLARAGRREFKKFNDAGVYPTLFPATDAQNATMAELNQGCVSKAEKSAINMCADQRVGNGCSHRVEQAIAESHRRALVAARTRNSTWTAILEDDSVPLDPENWDENFKELWSLVPPDVGFVRLGWCTFGDTVEKKAFASHAEWQLIDRPAYAFSGEYYTGGCTTAYLVHRNYISNVLRLFPCCSPLDCCYEWDLFYKPDTQCRKVKNGGSVCWGQHHMMGVDIKDSEKVSAQFSGKVQSGVVAQDDRKGGSIRINDINKEDSAGAKH